MVLLRPRIATFAALRSASVCRGGALVPARRLLCSKGVTKTDQPGASGDVSVTEPLKNAKGEVVKVWGDSVELPAVTKQQAENAFLDATDVTRAMTPPIATAVAARDDMLNDRFNYVSKHVNSSSQYIVAGGKGAVAPAAIGQGSFLVAGFCVLLGAIATAVYVKTQWGVNSAMELGDRLREKGASRKEMLERSGSARMVRTLSSNAENTVKEHVELVRRPSQQLGSHLTTSFKGVVKDGRPGGATAVDGANAASVPGPA